MEIVRDELVVVYKDAKLIHSAPFHSLESAHKYIESMTARGCSCVLLGLENGKVFSRVEFPPKECI